jgi:hypothetical protein
MNDFSIKMALWSMGCYAFGVLMGLFVMYKWTRKKGGRG